MTDQTGSAQMAQAMVELKQVVLRHFPPLLPAVMATLSAIATLKLTETRDVPALLLVGPASSSKTTVLSFFDSSHWLFYRSDRFTTKAFVSHHAATSATDLAKVDLLPKIRHRVLLTPEMGPLFRGRKDELEERFATIARVLDGQGIRTDSGVHGQRGYTGDYFFVWLGATTPPEGATFEVMANLGTRLFFLPVGDKEVTGEDLMAALEGAKRYEQAVAEVSAAVMRFVQELIPDVQALRSVTWADDAIEEGAKLTLVSLAQLVAAVRAHVPVLSRDKGNRPAEFGPPAMEQPYRALHVLLSLARGQAMLEGRAMVTLPDVEWLLPVAMGSGLWERRVVLQALAFSSGELPTSTVADALRVSKETARGYLRQMELLGLVESHGDENIQTWSLTAEFRWLASDRVRKVLTDR